MARKPSIKILKESAEKYGCENIGGGSIKSAIAALHKFFMTEYKEDELANCPECNNPGPEIDNDGKFIESCPYCAAVFVAAPAEDSPTPPIEKAKPKKKAPPKKTTRPKSAPKRGRIAKKRSRETREQETFIASPEQKEELALHEANIAKYRNSVARNVYDLGFELNHINDKGLWRGLGFDSFFAYTKNHLDYSRSAAYKYMLVAREFDRETFLAIGVKKGELVASAPERHQKKLLSSAKSGKSFSEIRAQLDKLEGKSKKPIVKVDPSKIPTPKAEAAPVPTSAPAETPKPAEAPIIEEVLITTAPEVVSEKISLLGRVKKNEDIEVAWIDANSHEPILRSSTEDKYAVVQLTDEVELTIEPSEDKLSLIVNFRLIGDDSSLDES